jgi:methionyl-tRNA formyltransferase
MNVVKFYNSMNIILCGSSAFAVPIFESLATDERFTVTSVITMPDAPKGRKNTITPTPVGFWAISNEIPTHKPEKISDPEFLKSITGEKPVMIVIAAYGKIIPGSLLTLPTHHTVNIHPSLLPLHRGPSPVQFTILHGDEITGVSHMIIDTEVDHGPLIGQYVHDLEGIETTENLLGTLSQLSSKHIGDDIEKYVSGEIEPVPQEHNNATFTTFISKEDGLLDTSESAAALERRIRAMNGNVNTYFTYRDKKIIVEEAAVAEKNGEVGTLFSDDELVGLNVADGSLLFERLKIEGKDFVSARDFMNGFHIE